MADTMQGTMGFMAPPHAEVPKVVQQSQFAGDRCSLSKRAPEKVVYHPLVNRLSDGLPSPDPDTEQSRPRFRALSDAKYGKNLQRFGIAPL